MASTAASSSGIPGPTSTIDIPDLALTVELTEPGYEAGATFHGRVRIQNTSRTDRLRFDIGRKVAATLHPDGTRAGGFSGAIAGLETTIDLAPETDTTISFVAGSSHSSPTGTAALPAGRYLLVVPLQIYLDNRSETVVTPPVVLVLVLVE